MAITIKSVTPLIDLLGINLTFPIPNKVWLGLSEIDKEAFARRIFKHFRDRGFPYHDLRTAEEFSQELAAAKKYYNASTLITSDGVVKQSMHLLGLAWQFFPHAYEVQCGDMKSPMDVFKNDTLLYKTIKKRMAHGTYFSNSGMRKSLGTVTGAQAVSNFRPTAAAAIYDRYCPNGGVVFDPCSGWGGRLLGAELSNNVSTYHGVEPSTKTFNGLQSLSGHCEITSNITQGCAEDILVPDCDVVFTSPPYFDCEKYAEEETQSYKKFPTKASWLKGFLSPMINNSVKGLKLGGVIAINIHDVKSFNTLSATCYNYLHDHPDLKFVEILKMQLSSINSINHKYEPIYAFRKIRNSST